MIQTPFVMTDLSCRTFWQTKCAWFRCEDDDLDGGALKEYVLVSHKVIMVVKMVMTMEKGNK